MVKRFVVCCAVFVSTWSISGVAHAEDATESAVVGVEVAPSASDVDAPHIRIRSPHAEALGVGYENGLWSGRYASGLRVKIPFPDHFGLMARVLMVNSWSGGEYRNALGERTEVYASSPLLVHFLRVYASGGIQVFDGALGFRGAKPSVGAGGEVGLEAFFGRTISVFVEAGGSSNAGPFAAGVTAVGGMTFYPFASDPSSERRPMESASR
jgi:hypothetical protein